MGSMHYNQSFDHFTSFPSSSNNIAGPSTYRPFMDSVNEPEQPPPPLTGDPTFDILEWHPAYQSCQRYFLDHAQHEPATQALCALINIRLPHQYLSNPITSSTTTSTTPAAQQTATYQFNFPRPGGPTLPSPSHQSRNGSDHSAPTFVSLIPYIRRLVVTGFDKAAILHGFFGDDYRRGVLPFLDCERRNYLFSAKHGGWRSTKKQYDSGSGFGGDESVPFMKPLDGAKMEELTNAEKAWSAWLAMEDWMVGPRAPEDSVDTSAMPDGAPAASSSLNTSLPDGVPEAFQDV